MGSAPSRVSPTPVYAPPGSDCLFADEDSENVDDENLSCFDCFDELDVEAEQLLLPDFNEGLSILMVNRVLKGLTVENKFAITPTSVPDENENKFIKVFTRFSGISASFEHQKLLLRGLVDSEGSKNASVKYNFTKNFSCKISSELANLDRFAPYMTVFQFDYEGKGCRSQFILGPQVYCGVEHTQIVGSNLSLGSCLYWQHDRSFAIDFDAKYRANNKMLAGVEVSSDGSFSLSYIHKLSEKVSLASELYRQPAENLILFGCLYKFNKYLVQGYANSNAVISAYLERTIGCGTRLLLSAKFDLLRKDYKFGYGLEFDRPTHSKRFISFEGIRVSLS